MCADIQNSPFSILDRFRFYRLNSKNKFCTWKNPISFFRNDYYKKYLLSNYHTKKSVLSKDYLFFLWNLLKTSIQEVLWYWKNDELGALSTVFKQNQHFNRKDNFGDDMKN